MNTIKTYNQLSTTRYECKYECNTCLFYTNKLTDYNRHISTQKHKNLSALTQPPLSLAPPIPVHKAAPADASSQTPTWNNSFLYSDSSINDYKHTTCYKCKFCEKKYAARNSAWYHEKKCKYTTNNPSIPTESSTSICMISTNQESLALALQNKTKDEVIDRLLKDNAEMMKLLKEIVPRIGPTTMIMNTTNHNKFNINVFLNEHCKDALNISDFVNSIKITMQDLKLTEERGIVESISNVLVQGLNDMDICKRPIHCTDLKRDILYVKENEQWERDETQEHLRKSVNDIAYKQILSVESWKNTLPNLNYDDTLQLQYNSLLKKTLADTGEKDIKKIVKSVCKQVYLSDIPSILQSQDQYCE
jgi:hypothetical protein